MTAVCTVLGVKVLEDDVAQTAQVMKAVANGAQKLPALRSAVTLQGSRIGSISRSLCSVLDNA